MRREARLPLRRMARALLVMLCLTLAAGMAAAEEARDYCAFGERSSLFIMDRTTQFDPADEKTLIGLLEGFYNALAAGERVLIVTIGAAATDMKVVFDECRPGCPSGRLLDRLVSACRPIAALGDLQGFEGRFIAAVAGAVKAYQEAPASELFRSIAGASRMGAERGYRS